MAKEKLTQEFSGFEVVSINPNSYPTEELLVAFRAGNIAIAHALTGRSGDADRIRDWGRSVDEIGTVLAKRWDDESPSSSST